MCVVGERERGGGGNFEDDVKAAKLPFHSMQACRLP